jgi:methionine-S-sulfoxide reductase
MKEVRVLGGGCFWCIEAVFRALRGVISVTSGYAGGPAETANYKSVCAGESGQVEVVQVVFDPSMITLRDILTVFFVSHDPTTLNRQGADVGEQYRSVIFYTTESQHGVAAAYIQEIAAESAVPVVTELAALDTFYPAEKYHQDYYANNATQPYCTIVIAPKLEKVEKQFAHLLETHGK